MKKIILSVLICMSAALSANSVTFQNYTNKLINVFLQAQHGANTYTLAPGSKPETFQFSGDIKAFNISSTALKISLESPHDITKGSDGSTRPQNNPTQPLAIYLDADNKLVTTYHKSGPRQNQKNSPYTITWQENGNTCTTSGNLGPCSFTFHFPASNDSISVNSSYNQPAPIIQGATSVLLMSQNRSQTYILPSNLSTNYYVTLLNGNNMSPTPFPNICPGSAPKK